MAIDGRKVLRLNLPLWQGGDRPDYRIGGRVLAAIVPEPLGPEETVAVPRAAGGERPVEGGIVSRRALLELLAAARSAIERHAPEAIVTLGGDCLVDLAPIAYLGERYGDDIRMHGPTNPALRGGVLSFEFRDLHPHDVSQVLDQRNVCIRAGHHCAKPLMRVLDVAATARASWYLYNDRDDIDALADALDGAADIFGFPSGGD